MRYLICLAIILVFFSCDQIVEGVAEELSNSINKKDSLTESSGDEEDNFLYHVSKEYKILEQKKVGDDSLFLAQRYYNGGTKYADIRYRNNLRDGLSVLYHIDGSVFCKIIFKKDCEYTVLEAFDTKGKKLNHGNLKNGTGKLIFYDALNDAKYSETNYLNSNKNGEILVYYSNGQISQKGTYINDRLQGAFAKYYKNGQIKEKGFFLDNVIDGEYMAYFPSGKLHQMEKWEHEKLQYSVEYDVKGLKIKEQKYQPKDSSHLETSYIYGNNGHLTSQGQFKNGLKYGAYSYYYENDKPKSVEIWRNDTLVREKTWYENGGLKSISAFKDSELDSVYTEYYKDGKLRLQQQYKNGKKNGKYFSYYANGQKYVVGNYKDNEPLGKFQYYTKEGVYKGENEFKIPKK